MKVDITNASEIERRMTVAVPAEQVDSEIDKAYATLKKTVKLRGFRPGKAPLSLLERYFKAQVEEDVMSRLVQETYTEALAQAEAKPVSQPKIENGVLERGADFSYTAVFEIKPVIDVVGYEGIALQKTEVTVTDDEVARELDSLRNAYATLQEVTDRPCQTGDSIVIDYEGSVDGAPYGEGRKEDFFITLTDTILLPGFGEAVAGMQIGETRSFSLEVPQDYKEADVAGKTVDFSVTLKNVKEKVLPELNDEFAKDLGQYSGVGELRTKLREQLLHSRQDDAEKRCREQVFEALIASNSFEVPNGMVEMQARNMLREMQQMLSQQGMSMEQLGQSTGALYESYKKPAEKQVRSALLLEAVADKVGVTVSDEEIAARYEEIAEQVQQDVATVKEHITDEMIRPQLVEKKALDYIKEKAVYTEKTSEA